VGKVDRTRGRLRQIGFGRYAINVVLMVPRSFSNNGAGKHQRRAATFWTIANGWIIRRFQSLASNFLMQRHFNSPATTSSPVSAGSNRFSATSSPHGYSPICGAATAHLVHVVVLDLRAVDELPEVRAALQNGVAIDAHRRAALVFDAT